MTDQAVEQPDRDRQDRALLAAFAAGDEEALGALAFRHERALVGVARGLLGGSVELAEEAVQETWLRVIRFASSYRGESTVKTWLYRITINRSRDISARERRQGRLVREAADRLERTAEGETEPGLSAALQSALAQLDAVHREAVLLAHASSLSQRAAAEILGVPEGTLKARVRRGLAKLRKIMEPEEVRAVTTGKEEHA